MKLDRVVDAITVMEALSAFLALEHFMGMITSPASHVRPRGMIVTNKGLVFRLL